MRSNLVLTAIGVTAIVPLVGCVTPTSQRVPTTTVGSAGTVVALGDTVGLGRMLDELQTRMRSTGANEPIRDSAVNVLLQDLNSAVSQKPQPPHARVTPQLDALVEELKELNEILRARPPVHRY